MIFIDFGCIVVVSCSSILYPSETISEPQSTGSQNSMDEGMEDEVAPRTAASGVYSDTRQARENGSVNRKKRLRSHTSRDEVETELDALHLERGGRDQEVEELRRRLEFAVKSEQQALDEISAVTDLLSSERLQLKTQVAQLEAQLRVTQEALEDWKRQAIETKALLRSTARQSELETQLLRDQLATATSSTNGQSEQELVSPSRTSETQEKLERLEKELQECKRHNSALANHLERAEKQLAVYDHRLGRGEFNPATTKVVHLAVNPTSEILASRQKPDELAALRQENAMLRAELERSSGMKTPSVKSTQSSVASKQTFTTTTSYETVEGLKLLNKRLKEVFSEQIQHYREAVYLLTGYKIDLKKSNGVDMLRLRSVYAEHDRDDLNVKMESNGALELLDSDFAAQLNHSVLGYLTTCRSFPAFLATLTLQLFEKQTFQG